LTRDLGEPTIAAALETPCADDADPNKSIS
jgi:hypothetical protein